ncbi:MAG: hypothetical protein JXR64_08455 [Spirochaetales bacterium]|nr:hypothetical protein [Spirochaetales bacterium]
MINTGKMNKLSILRETSIGLYLGDNSGHDVLLPNKYCPVDYNIGDQLEVFVYLDRSDRQVATNIIPKITLGGFANLRVESVTDAGAFVDMGLDKHLYVPKSEQKIPMELGETYFIYMMMDESTGKLFGTRRIERNLDNEILTVENGEEVELVVYEDAGLGYSVIVNNIHKGMIYKNEIFRDLRIGEKVKGWVKKIREDNKIDISLNPIGYKKSIDPNMNEVMNLLTKEKGYLPLNDKSEPEDIYALLKMSKKAFKKAIGSLYKEKRIVIEEEGIRLT